ncbi:MAG: AraC family transcriptional regulator N-terminal domain-containing protein [Deinococcales bacterium]
MILSDVQDEKWLEQTAHLRADLKVKLAQWSSDGILSSTPITGLTLYHLSAINVPVPSMYEPSLAVVVQGEKRVVVGEEVYFYDESHYLLTSVDLPALAQVTKTPYLAFTLKLEMPIIRQLIADFDLQIPKDIMPSQGMVTAPATPELFAAFLRLVDLLKTPQDIPALAGLIKREIFYRLLVGEQGGRLRQIALSGTQSNRIAKAITWLKENYTKPLQIEELAANANMGVSTLHHHFRAMTLMSPLQYQKQLRLHEARRLMLEEGLAASTAALRVGYESPSQFNREYRRLFGQPPLRDIKGLQLAADGLKNQP